MPRPKLARVRTTMEFHPSLYEEMRQEAAEQDVPVAHLVREAVKRYLAAVRATSRRSA